MAEAASFIARPKTPVAGFTNADGTAFKTIMTAGTLGSRIDSLIASNTDAANSYVLQLAVQVSAVDYVIGEVLIPAGAASNGTTKSVAALNSTTIPALAHTEAESLFLAAGVSLRARVKTPMAGGSFVQLVGIAGDY